MSLETIALIGVLTLLTIGMGTEFSWLIVMKPALSRISDRAFLEIIENILLQAVKVIPIILLMLLLFAVILNIISHSRSEPYLLAIGLLSLIAYLGLLAIASVSIHQVISLPNGTEAQLTIRQLQGKWDVISWFRWLSILVSYWSFLHYALNPKIEVESENS